MSSKKELVVIGDSFCIDYVKMRNMMANDYSGGRYLLHVGDEVKAYTWTQQKSFPVWGDIIAKELNLKVVNLGQSGTGTNFIFAEALDYIINNKDNIEKVIISWSGYSRVDFELPAGRYPDHHPRPWLTVNPAMPQSINVHHNKILSAAKAYNTLSFEVGLNNFFRHAYVLQNLLESYGIDYRMIQSITDGHAFPKFTFDKGSEGGMHQYAKKLINNPYFDLINDEKFIGWPGVSNLGGFAMTDLIWTEDNKNHISYLDKHPNENGHKIIAKAVLDDL